MKPKTKTLKRSKRSVSQCGRSASEDAKRKLVDLWLGFDGNEAKAILEAFKIGFEDGIARTG